MRDTKSYKWDALRPKGGLKVQEILSVQKKIVPEFVSKNSEFEILDKASF